MSSPVKSPPTHTFFFFLCQKFSRSSSERNRLVVPVKQPEAVEISIVLLRKYNFQLNWKLRFVPLSVKKLYIFQRRTLFAVCLEPKRRHDRHNLKTLTLDTYSRRKLNRKFPKKNDYYIQKMVNNFFPTCLCVLIFKFTFVSYEHHLRALLLFVTRSGGSFLTEIRLRTNGGAPRPI